MPYCGSTTVKDTATVKFKLLGIKFTYRKKQKRIADRKLMLNRNLSEMQPIWYFGKDEL